MLHAAEQERGVRTHVERVLGEAEKRVIHNGGLSEFYHVPTPTSPGAGNSPQRTRFVPHPIHVRDPQSRCQSVRFRPFRWVRGDIDNLIFAGRVTRPGADRSLAAPSPPSAVSAIAKRLSRPA